MSRGRRRHWNCTGSGGSSAFARQREIDASIAARAEYEYLYDKPYEDRSRVRVAGPFTVESISPHRVLGVDENGDVIDGIAESRNGYGTGYDFGPDHPGHPATLRRAAGPPRGPYQLHVANALAGAVRLRRGAVRRGRQWG